MSPTRPLLLLLAALMAPWGLAREAEEEGAVETASGPIEEVVVIGRYRAAATDVVSERIDSDVPVDFIDSEFISRVGDSDAAAALRRVPGLTLVEDKFIYVRGLGERYSSALLNGAIVPSPDLTRNVLPLDIFPAEIIDALAVTKGYAPDLPAAFGGGNVDIRTKRVPEEKTLSIKLNTGWNSESDDGFSYHGGSDDKWGEDDGTRKLPADIASGIQTYKGSFSPSNILDTLQNDGAFHTIDEATAINRELATALNRNVDIKDKSLDPDIEGEITGGYRWFLGERWELGFLALGSYQDEWRNRDRTVRRISNPTTDFADTERTVRSTNLTGSLNLGVRFTDDHEIGTVSMLLRNTEDEAFSSGTCQQGQFNDCSDPASPVRGRIYGVRYEERELRVDQVSGEHTLGVSTLDMLPDALNFLERFRDSKLIWFYSDSEATTEIPNEVSFSAEETLDPATGAVLTTRVRSLGTAGDFRFSELDDEVQNYGYDITVPIIQSGRWDVEVGGGYNYTKKGRDYLQVSMGIGSSVDAFDNIRENPPSQVFSDANILDPNNGIELLLGVGGFGSESYLAAQIVEAGYGKFDILFDDTWRVAGGARKENFSQISIPVDPLEFESSRIGVNSEADAQALGDTAILEDEWYPSLSLTWIRPDFWAEEFQLRFGWSETVARPDLREISESTYIDPLTEARVRGNPNLKPSDLTNYDIRGEWFWDSGDNFTVSLFYKDIDQPIETVQGGATEDNILFNFVNADTAEVYGIEVEGLKGLDFMSNWVGGWVDALYVAGNVTLSDSEIKIPVAAGVGNITNQRRRMTQQSDWVVNLQLGYDSFSGKHGATLVYNAFGERVFFAGINGFDDAFEQPFHSLDFVYSWYPTAHVSLKLRLKNLLDEKVEIEQQDVTVIEQNIGTTGLIDFKWSL